MFKSYLEDKLHEKSKEIESKSKVDKQVTLMKFKGNQRQFEHNAQIDSIFDRLTSANVPENKNLTNLIVDGKELIRKRQKLIRIDHFTVVFLVTWPLNGNEAGGDLVLIQTLLLLLCKSSCSNAN